MEATAMNKDNETDKLKIFKNSYHRTFEFKWLTVYTQDLNFFSVIVNPIVSLQNTKD